MSTAPPSRLEPTRESGIPRLPPWHLARPGLATALHDTEEPLVVLRGPGGAGKTTLAAEIAHHALAEGRAVVWLDVSRLDDRTRIARDAARRLAAVGALDEGVDPDAVAGGLAETATALRRPALLVLDGYGSRMHGDVDDDVLAALRTSSTLTVVVTTRLVGRLESLEARLRTGVRVVTTDELAFDAVQVAGLCAAAGITVPDEAVDRTVAATGGLPVFVRAVVLAAREDGLPLTVASRSTIVAVASRAGRMLLDAESRDTLADVLNVLTVPPAVTEDLAELLVDGGRAALRAAEEAGLGDRVTTRGVERFRFTPVVRTTLRSRLRQADPDRYRLALETTTAWASRTSDHAIGLETSLERGDYTAAQAHLLARWASPSSRMPDDARQAVYELSLGTLARYPILALATALLYFSDRRDRVRAAEMLAVAVAGAVAWYPRASPGERAILLGAESVAYRLLGRGGRAASAARRALRAIDQIPLGEDPLLDAARPLGMQQLAGSLLAVGDLEAALSAAELAALALPRDDPRTLQARIQLAGILATEGQVDRAAEIVDDLPTDAELVRAFGVYYAAMATIARAYVALERADVDGARSQLRLLDEEMRTNEYWPLHALAWSDLDLMTGATEATGATGTQDRLDPADSRAPASATWRGRLAVARSHVALAQGRGDEATGELRGLSSEDPVVRAARARVRHGQGDDAPALKELGSPPDSTFGTRVAIEHHILRGLCLAGTGDKQAATRELERALALSRSTGCRLPWLLTSEADRAVVTGLAGHAAEVLGDLPVVVPSRVGLTTLSERELVVLEHLASGQELPGIARTLHVSPNTVKTQLRGVYRKLGVRGRDDAVLEARRRGILR